MGEKRVIRRCQMYFLVGRRATGVLASVQELRRSRRVRVSLMFISLKSFFFLFPCGLHMCTVREPDGCWSSSTTFLLLPAAYFLSICGSLAQFSESIGPCWIDVKK